MCGISCGVEFVTSAHRPRGSAARIGAARSERAVAMLAATLLVMAAVPSLNMGDLSRIALLHPATIRSGALAIVCPCVCAAVGLEGRDFDPSLLSLIIATPSAFSINAAFQRRERALCSLAQFRSAAYMIDAAFERWACEEDRMAGRQELLAVYANLVRTCEAAPNSREQRSAKAALTAELRALGSSLERMRRNPTAASEAGIEPLATVFVSDERLLVQATDQVRVVSSTQTPFLLRAFTVAGASLFPVVFAPYFAATASQPDRRVWAAYLVSFLFAVTISSLVRIQEALENPFDGDRDDIDLSRFAPP
jgi:hypothetical protein